MIKNFFSPKRYQLAPSAQDPQDDNPWDELGQVKFMGGGYGESKTAELKSPKAPEAIVPNPRQQRKIIRVLSSGDFDTINDRDADVSGPERQQILFALKDNDFSDQDLDKIIDNIAGPLSPDENSSIPPENLDKIYGQMSSLKHERRILAEMSGLGFDNYEDTNANSLVDFANKYSNPAKFESDSQTFLNKIKALNSPQKYQEYVMAMNNFKHLVYGKKQEYYDQIKLLKSEAKHFEGKTYLAEKYFNHATADGDPFVYRDTPYVLTKETLADNNLEPRHELKIKNAEIGLSDIFKVGSRDACVAYVKIGDEVKIRSFYRSRSAALWRYLPDYVMENDEVKYYGKAGEEERLTLPFELQVKLSKIGHNHEKITLNPVSSEFFLCASAKHYHSMQEYGNALEYGNFRGEYYEEADSLPSLILDSLSMLKKPPEEVDVPNELSPDYSQPKGSYILDSHPYYGDAKVNLFPSQNGALLYSICETEKDGQRQVWIGNIEEPGSPLGSTGCYKEWVSSGDLLTPLYEYTSQANGYGDNTDRRGNYQNMWRNYLSKIPIIKRYLEKVPM